MNANHFEAKLHGLRRAKDGVVVSFVVHPNDVTEAFSRLAVAPLGQRYMVAYSAIGDDDKPMVEPEPNPPPKPTADKPAKDRRPFESLPLSQQAAIRCQDKEFQGFCGVGTAEDAADYVRAMCGVVSRSELNNNRSAAVAWNLMETRFQACRTDKMYGEYVK